MFIISTEFKTMEIDSAAKAAQILKGLVARLPEHRGVEIVFWASDWRGYEQVLYLANVKAGDVGHMPPYAGSYRRGFRSVWK